MKKLKDKLMGPKLFKATQLLIDSLEKAKKAEIGAISPDGKRKKVAEGKWVPVGKDKPGKNDKKPEKDKKDKDKEKKPISPEKEAVTQKIKETLKKFATILSETLSGKEGVTPAAQAAEQVGESIKGKAKPKIKPKAKTTEKPKKEGKK
jgi:hypothetical protein